MNVLRIELVKEIGRLCEYKVVYEESNIYTVKVVGKTFNYDYDEIKNIPESVISFAEKWILGDL